VTARIYDHALATGFSRGFEIAAGCALIALIVALTLIRVRRENLTGTAGPAAG